MALRRIGEKWIDEQLVVVGSVKDAPGVTTVAVGMVAGWPRPDHVVLLEADPDGGDLAARFGHHPDPGLMRFAAAAPSGPHTGVLRPPPPRPPVGRRRVLAPPRPSAVA